MKNQELMVNLITEIDKIIDDKHDEDDFYFNPDAENILNEFSNKLNDLFPNGIDDEIINMISKLEYKNIFSISVGDEYINNPIRIKIEKYLNDNEFLYLDYDIIKDNIKRDYKLVKYLKDTRKVVELVDYNEEVFLLMEGKYATKDLIQNHINKSEFISKIFLGLYGKESDIYIFSKYYKNIDNIDKILLEQLKGILKEDPLLFINASDIIKENKLIQDYVVSLDPRMSAYIK